ncbi:MAG: cytochrome c biogenesis protein CcsA [Actinobacteria bacterium]|jgi:heme exporter protein C|nr:cytochrome c biogenesis protein CcsA [Actinomycetota bacterium]MCL6094480.1 cytochrome c biogenesis protein CcsA [Actinomycetota bacterium]
MIAWKELVRKKRNAIAGGTMKEGTVVEASSVSGSTSPYQRYVARSRPWLAITGISSVVLVGITVWLGMWVTPPAQVMGQLVRLVYVHPPVAWVALYLAFGLTTLSSLLYLWRRTRSMFWDRLAGVSAEVGLVFIALTLATGSIWARPTWGVWWTWDARLTSTALLFVLYLGYLALRHVPGERETKAKRSAIAAIVAFIDVPIVHYSVQWWRTLHQPPTVLDASLSPKIYGLMAWTLLIGFIAFTLVFVWLLIYRYQIALLEDEVEQRWLEEAITERRSEGGEHFALMDGVDLHTAGSVDRSAGETNVAESLMVDAPELNELIEAGEEGASESVNRSSSGEGTKLAGVDR